jgi:hypothetical protein
MATAKNDDDMEEILRMTPEAIDAELREHGGDPAAIRARGDALAKELAAEHDRNAWKYDVRKKLDAVRAADADIAAKRVPLPRAEILSRLDAARKSPRFAAPVAALFRDRKAEESTDEELQQLLEEVELLMKLEGDGSSEK